MNQTVAQNLDYLPFGEITSSDSGTSTHKFTGDERDAETGLDHTWVSGFVLANPEREMFRQYSSQFGRWMTPDPAGLAAADPSNPQSWNRYSYVLNNSLAFTDPLGLDQAPSSWDNTGGGGIASGCIGAEPGSKLFDQCGGYQGYAGGGAWWDGIDPFSLLGIPVYSQDGWIPWTQDSGQARKLPQLPTP